MNIQTLLDADDAVSPVIGVILMVAITVILAAVIGTFVLGQANQLNENAPTTDFNYDGQSGSTNDYTITHSGGDDFTDSNVDISYTDSAGTSLTEDWGTSDSTISAGGSKSIEGVDSGTDGIEDTGVQADSTIRVNWASAEGGSSSTIGSYEVPA